MKSTLNTYRHLPRAERPRFARTVVLVLAWFLVGYALLLGGLGRVVGKIF